MNNGKNGQHLSIADLVSKQKPGWSLDQRFYTDPVLFHLVLVRMISKIWIVAGLQSQLPLAGDLRVV
jgi:Rieske 2Fe-2S family protein